MQVASSETTTADLYRQSFPQKYLELITDFPKQYTGTQDGFDAI